MRITSGTGSIVAVAAVLVIVGSAAPASADDTDVTFTLTGGALEISAPLTSDLGDGVAGGSAFSAQLGPVTVTDDRGALLATWTADVASGDFVTGGGTPAETLAAATDIAYWSGAATATTGTGTFTPGQATEAAAEFIDAADVFSKSTGAGNNSATWDPTIIVTPTAASVAGVYSATVVHEVS